MNQKAFTTIELIISMTIVIVLITLITPNLIGYLDNTTRQEYDAAKTTVIHATDNYINDTGGYNVTRDPITLQTLLSANYISDKTIEVIYKYSYNGLSGATIIPDLNAVKTTIVCVDKENKKVTYEVTGC